jgi:CPA2 family monovalent cation:H+ antiporter-2
MTQLIFIKDFAIIMVVAGMITFLFRRFHQSPIVGYLSAGLLLGPYALPVSLVTDPETIGLLADLGLILLLFGLGLEFSWNKIRQIGMSALVIGVLEILTMFSIGYSLGKFLGWSTTDAIFLGAALHISSSAVISKILRDTERLHLLSSRISVGILVVEDFAAVFVMALLSGIATTGMANFGDVGSLLTKLVIFTVVSLVLGTLIVPRIIKSTYRFRSKEALLITALGLCFVMALLSNYLGLSVAAGAFLIGALIGNTEHSEEIAEIIAPVRDMFAALFFVAIGMLIDVTRFKHFVVPAIIVAAIFILGKILSVTLATFTAGYDQRTALQVGMSMPVMGEFSIAIAKLGMDYGVLLAPLYPVVASVTVITSLTGPSLVGATEHVAGFLSRRSPPSVKIFILRLGEWIQTLRAALSRDDELARRVRHCISVIIINLLILVAIIGVGTAALHFVESLASYVQMRPDIVGLGIGFGVLLSCTPPFMAIWRNIRTIGDQTATYLLSQRPSAKKWHRRTLRILLRDSIVVLLATLVSIWFIPFMSNLFFIGSVALVIPLLFFVVILYLISRSVLDIHGQLERTLGESLLGDRYASRNETTGLLHPPQTHTEDLPHQASQSDESTNDNAAGS